MTSTRPTDRGVAARTAAPGQAPGRTLAGPIVDAVRRSLAEVGPGLYGVACSGGADSIALAHAAISVAGGAHVVVVAIDHQLVPGSAQVAEGVARWATGQGAAAVVRAVDVGPRASLEAAARDARYAALDAIADELGMSVVLVGHTARDQAETVLMRIIRGTGPAGLAGIPARRGRFVRPLLGVTRAEVDTYVATHHLPVATDPMNADHRVARVRARRDLLPALRRENPQVDAALRRLATSAGEWLAVIDALAEPFARLPIDCAKLARQPVAVRKRAVSRALEAAGLDLAAVHLERIDHLVTRPPRGQAGLDVPAGKLVRTYDQLDLAAPPHHRGPPAQVPVAPVGPYVMRPWRPGDRMRPVRLCGKSRKLSDLFIDAKIPRGQRTGARVVVRTTDDVIVWAEHVGAAFDAREDELPNLPDHPA